ncbi:serine/threonine-protein kinase ULK3 [Pelomyxa schiedti]|nr:serine/threonine-protein kinase ULK3 [Pelomyxa schiedti]
MASYEPAPAQVWGDYRLQQLLGRGSFGSVFKAENTRTRQICAVKFVNVDRMPPNSQQYLKQEIELLQMLKHPHIIRLIEHGVINSFHLIVTEFVGGGALSEYLTKNGPVKEDQMQIWAVQLVSAVIYLRERRISHRDLKPANILLTSDVPPVLKLCDFGFARMYPQNEVMMSELGSPLYEAPEIRSRNYGPSVDLWSMGLILLEMLLGKPAITAQSFQELHTFLDDPRDLPLPIKCSPSCGDLLTSLLKKNPNNRITWEHLKTHPFVRMPPVVFVCGCTSTSLPPTAFSSNLNPHTLMQLEVIEDLCVQLEKMNIGIRAVDQNLMLLSSPPTVLKRTDRIRDVIDKIKQFGLFVFNCNIDQCNYPAAYDLSSPFPIPEIPPPFVFGNGQCSYEEFSRLQRDHSVKLQVIDAMGAVSNTRFQSGLSFYEPMSSLFEGIKCLSEHVALRIKEVKEPEREIADSHKANVTRYTDCYKSISASTTKAMEIQLPKELASPGIQTAYQLFQSLSKPLDTKMPPTATQSQEIRRMQGVFAAFSPHIASFQTFFEQCKQNLQQMHKLIDEVNAIISMTRTNQNSVDDAVKKYNTHRVIADLRPLIRTADHNIIIIKAHNDRLLDGAKQIYTACVEMWKKFYFLTRLIGDLGGYIPFLEKIVDGQKAILKPMLEAAERNDAILRYISLLPSTETFMRDAFNKAAEDLVAATTKRAEEIQSITTAVSKLVGKPLPCTMPVLTKEQVLAALTPLAPVVDLERRLGAVKLSSEEPSSTQTTPPTQSSGSSS